MGATFIPVSGTAVNLQDVKVVGYEGETADEVNAAVLDEYGRTVTTYFFADLPEDEIYGWLDDNEETPDVMIQPGDGLWIYSANTDLQLQYAGQVMTSDLSVLLIAGSKMVVNPTPVQMNLQDVQVAGYEGETADQVNAAILDEYGRTVTTYFFADLPDDDIYGWLDDNEETPDVMIDPGAGLWVYAESDDFSLVLPGVKL